MYFQEHSEAIRQKAAKEIEVRQMPGYRGEPDDRQIMKPLIDIDYSGYIEIFMHPAPRGLSILPTVAEITAAINRSRDCVERCRLAVAG